MLMAATVVAGASLGLLAVGIVAASGKARHRLHYVNEALNCPLPQSGNAETSGLFLTLVPPRGSTSLALPEASGPAYGFVKCPAANVSGVVREEFTNDPNTGNQTGTIQEYFGGGRIQGTYKLILQSGSSGFSAATYTGILKIATGTGIYSGVIARKPYTFACSTTDGVHISCSEDLTLSVQKPVS